MITRYKNKAIKRRTKTRAKLRRLTDRLRLTVFRSNKYIYAQIIDDQKGQTLVAIHEKELAKELKGKNQMEKAGLIGEALAKKALKKKIKRVYFDRGGYKYHGRVKALAEGARKGGLEL